MPMPLRGRDVYKRQHVDILRLNARTETVIGVTEMEELDPENDSSRCV